MTALNDQAEYADATDHKAVAEVLTDADEDALIRAIFEPDHSCTHNIVPLLTVVADIITTHVDTALAKVSLQPAESIALTVAANQMDRGEEITSNVAAACVIALDRIHDVLEEQVGQ
ncbi:hypothetical protein [Nocardioides sp.]|uniref:hypothetical protein n=1 Tax=Nocardioides sp. TaxID=35761 RepID=UPI003563111F